MKRLSNILRLGALLVLSAGLTFALTACGDDNGNGTQDAGQDMGQDMGNGGMASVQIIHNSADPNASTVDIFADGELLVDDLEFRTATGFVDVPAGDYSIAIGAADAGDNETLDDGEAIDSWDVTLEADTSYTVVADGVVDPNSFAENPDEADIALDLKVATGALETAENQGIALRVHHGATDVGAAEIFEGNNQDPAATISYGEFSPYLTYEDASVTRTFDIGLDSLPPAAEQHVQVSSSTAPSGTAATVLASGFANPPANADGPALDIIACPGQPAEGDRVECVALPEAARAQIIHAAPSEAASEVGLCLAGQNVGTLSYLEALPYWTLPSGAELPVALVGAGQSDCADPILEETVGPLEAEGTFAAIASGTGENLGIRAGQSIEYASSGSNVGITIFHGSPDAPNVDVIATNPEGGSDIPLAEGVSFGSFALAGQNGEVDGTVDYSPLTLVNADNDEPIVGFDVSNLSNFQGLGVVAVAHGYVEPPMDVTDRDFGVTVFTINGQTSSLDPAGQ